MIDLGKNIRDSVKYSVWDSTKKSITASVRPSVRISSERESVISASVWNPVADSVRMSTWREIIGL